MQAPPPRERGFRGPGALAVPALLQPPRPPDLRHLLCNQDSLVPTPAPPFPAEEALGPSLQSACLGNGTGLL